MRVWRFSCSAQTAASTSSAGSYSIVSRASLKFLAAALVDVAMLGLTGESNEGTDPRVSACDGIGLHCRTVCAARSE